VNIGKDEAWSVIGLQRTHDGIRVGSLESSMKPHRGAWVRMQARHALEAWPITLTQISDKSFLLIGCGIVLPSRQFPPRFSPPPKIRLPVPKVHVWGS
jgi:hypothetical protein